MSKAHGLSRLLIPCTVLLSACGGATSDPTRPGDVTPTPTPASCTAGAPSPMTSFTANPSTITQGESFTLSWTAPCGFVSLRIKDQAHFALNQPSNGSYELKPGLAGYPSTTGATVYEATNGDAAPRLSTTVTVSPRPTPTPTPAPAPNRAPTVSVTGSGTCHPRPGAPCTVTLTANATDPDGDGLTYSWSGCTSGSGASAACSVAGLSTYTGTVVVSDGRGSTATASGTATGTNLGVDSGSGTWCTDGGCGVSSVSVGQVAVYQNPFNARDDAGYCTCVAVVSGTCTGLGPSCASGSEINQAVYATGNGTCNLTVTVTDPWGQHSDVSAWLTVTP